MSKSRINELLYDSETVLRLVDREIEELRDDSPDASLEAGDPLAVLLVELQHRNAETLGVLTALHESRVALREVTLREIHECCAKVREVAAATEIASARILDGLERAHLLVDALDRLNAVGVVGDEAPDASHVRMRLRDELFALMGALQFQDITSQQLGHISKMLNDAERRVHATASLLDGGLTEAAVIVAEPSPTFAESATTRDAFERQSLADTVFWEQPGKRVTH